ncbi:hypothetical protein [Clostridium sp.]|uniref:hypothetical protein n=1 Tax=Clostridium sp. TaxID=1506 RepID=UPI001A3F8183|nr:hypothetical protein [Clostridium sp.]MBK5239870.1 hypothetical protein [Clostridium sp.]
MKTVKSLDKIKKIEAEIENYKKKKRESARLNKVQTESNGSGSCWNTIYYTCDN